MTLALPLPRALCLMGPTAAGKTALAVTLAQQLNAEIISVDSALVFKGMDIGTAKPSLSERGGIVHHLIDILEPNAAFSTGQFRRRALDLMHAISQRGRVPLLVGGTMLYFRALTEGLAELPEADAALRKRLTEELNQLGSVILHQRLAKIDPESAARIHPHDPQRIQRALEVYELSGQPLSAFFTLPVTPLPYQITKIVVAPVQRSVLHERIALRFHAMLAQGFLAEVETLMMRGDLHLQLPALRTVGYRQAWAYLHGETDYNTMTEHAIIATRQLAKRQFTWLRRETDALWFDSDTPNLADTVLVQL